jgi:hypothetical protein
MKSYLRTKETLEKMKISHLGQKGFWKDKKFSAEHIANLKKNHKGMIGLKHSENTKKKMSEAQKGREISLETRLKMGKSQKLRKIPENVREKMIANLPHGINNFRWKGEDVGYRGLHYWVESQLGKPDICEHCGKNGLKGRQIHWANISGQYKREITDWIRLCSYCHMVYDTGKRNKRIPQPEFT